MNTIAFTLREINTRIMPKLNEVLRNLIFRYTHLPLWTLALGFMCLVLIGRIPLLKSPTLPINDGGLFIPVVRMIRTNPLSYPQNMGYNLPIPFAYPPLGMYLLAAISAVIPNAELPLFTLTPFIIAILCIPLFFLLAYYLTKSRSIAGIATLITAIIPESYQWIIMGAGITRATGAFFALCTLVAVVLWQQKPSRLLFCLIGLFCGLVFLSHPDTSVFIVYSVCIFILTDQTETLVQRILTIMGILGIGGIIAAPWPIRVITFHGFTPYAFVAELRQHNGFPMENLIWILSNELQYRLLLVSAASGILIAYFTKYRRLIIWAAVVLVARATSMISFDVFPLALLAGIGLTTLPVIFTKQIYRQTYKAIVIMFLLFSFPWSVQTVSERFTRLRSDDISALEWVKQFTPQSARFILISSQPDWWKDAVPEWFPAITGRISLVTVQGSEWTPFTEHHRTILFHQAIRRCNQSTIACIESAATLAALPFSHLYLVKHKDQPGVGDYCPLLLHSIRNSANYRVIFGNEAAEIWERTDTLPSSKPST